MFDMTYFANREDHAFLESIGGKKWLSVKLMPRTEDRGRHAWSINLPENQKKKILNNFNTQLDNLALIYGISHSLATGPKVLIPSSDSCTAMERIDILLPFSSYAQPFPCMIIQLPSAWKERAKQDYQIEQAPDYIVCTNFPEGIATHVFYSNRSLISHFISNRPEYQTIEDSLAVAPNLSDEELREDEISRQNGKLPKNLFEYNFTAMCQRMALNLCLLATHVGVKKLGWMDPKQRKKHERIKDKDERGRVLAMGDFMKIALNQEVDLPSVVEHEERGDSVSEHKSPRPHWRRGHWRLQTHGKGYSLRKSILIREVFVNPAKGQPP